MTDLGTMAVNFTANTAGLSSGIQSAIGALGKFASGAPGLLGPVGLGLTAVGAAALGIGITATNMAGDFQQSMLKVKAYAGLSGQAFDDMQNKILDMATAVGKSPKELADALYPIISSGYASADALNILHLSAMTSAASGAKMSVVADALTTSLGSMHAPASQAGHYMDMFNKIVALGKGEVPQYAAVIGKLSLSAGSAKIPFGDMGAALATLTTHGFPSVAQAANSLGSLFTQIGPKVDTLAARAKALGLHFDENKFKTMDLADKLNYLAKITGNNQGEMLKLVGGNTLALKAFNALHGSAGDFTANLKAMGGAAGTTSSVFSTAMSGWNASAARLGAAFQVLMVKLGEQLLPILTKVANFITPLVVGFTTWVTSSHAASDVMGTLQGVIAPLMPILSRIGGFLVANFVPVWQQLVTTWQTSLLPSLKQLWSGLQPLLPVIAGLAAIIGGILVAGLAAAIKGLAGFLSGVIIVFSGLVKIVSGVFQILGGLVQFLIDLFTGHFDKLSADLGMIWQGIINIFLGAWTVIAGIFMTAWYTISGMVTGFIDGIIGYFQALSDMLVGHSIIPDMVNAIIQWFTSLPGKALAAVQALASNLTGFFTNLASQAVQWGSDLISNLIAGIQNMAGNLTNTISGIAGNIAGFLHFSKPDVGPLASADTWMPDFGDMLSRGLAAQSDKLNKASLQVAHSIAIPPSALRSTSSAGAMAAAASGGTTHIHNHLYIDGKELAGVLVNPIGEAMTSHIRTYGAVGQVA